MGINLQVARIAIHFDLPWNPMVLEQRVGRVHRIGSTRTILVETILLRGSREAEVFERITHRLQEIVRDLSSSEIEREALFRRILASLDPDKLRELFMGQGDLDAVGAAVDAGRVAVEEADKNMRELQAQTAEQHGRATMDRLVSFVTAADPGFKRVDTKLYAVLTESDGGELRQVERETEVYTFDGDDDRIVFDRTAASYLGLRRDQTGGIGNSRVDPLLRSSIDLTSEPKARSSTWVALLNEPTDVCRGGDVIYFGLEADCSAEEFTASRLRAWRIRAGSWSEMNESEIETILWDTEFVSSRKAGDMTSMDAIAQQIGAEVVLPTIHFPIAAIGVRSRSEIA